MRGFESDRKWIIEKKNDVAIRAMDNKEKTDQFIEKNDEIEEGISRIPTDLPDEIKESADEVMDMADSISEDLKEKGNKLRDLSGIPIIGSFAETKGNEVLDQADQIVDLRQETQQYQDDLNVSRNRLMGNR